MPGDRTVDRKSCHFQFSIADTALDGLERVQQVARAAEAQGAGSPWRRRQPPPSPQSHGPGDRVLRLRTRTTRECIEWVHLLRKLSVDRLLYPELLPLGVQRLLRGLFQRALRNADGTVKEAELGRQLQHDRILSAVVPEEFRAPASATAETEDVAMAAVEAAAVAAWLFDGEDATHEVLADAVAGAAKSGGDKGDAVHSQTNIQASSRYERGMTLETFVHEMNSRHHEALETATAPYVICTTSEALAKLRSEFELPEHLDSAGVVWVVEEKLGLPHELPPAGSGASLLSTASASESMAAPSPSDGQDRDRAGGDLGMLVPSADTLMVAAPLAAVDHAEVIDEALVLIFAHLGQRAVLVPEEDPSTSKTVAMEGLMRVLNADIAAAGGGATARGETTLGQGQSSSSMVESSPQQLVDYNELDDDDHETSPGDVSPSVMKLRALKLGHASTSGLGSYDSEAAADPGTPGGGGSGWGPLKSTGLRDRPYGSYRRSRRKPLPSPRQQQQEQSVQAAIRQRHLERSGGNPLAELGMVPSAEAPISSSLQARLTISLRHSPLRSTSDMSQSEEIAAALTPTDTYKHLSHAQQKEMRKQDFQEMMAAATAVAQAEEPAAAAQAAPTQRLEARRVAEQKRRQSAEKKAKAAAARAALHGLHISQTVQQGSGDSSPRDSPPGAEGAPMTTQLPSGDNDWASRVGAGTSAHSILTQLGLK
jgi:hypothetical protein